MDLDGDGASDLAATDRGEIVLLSGATGERLGSMPREHVDTLESLETRQGHCLITGGGGAITCLSMDTKAVLWRYGAPFMSYHRVPCVRRIPDVDGDGVQDIVAGFEPEWESMSSTLHDVREVLVCLSGSTGRRLFGVNAQFGDRLGHSIASCGDWDGDGVGDFIAGAPQIVIRRNTVEPGEGYAFVISGREGEILSWIFSRRPTTGFGWSCAALEGTKPRLLISAHESLGEQALYSLSAADRKPRRLHAEDPFSDFGYLVKVVGDQDGDGVEDYAVSTVYQDIDCDRAGSVTVFSGADDCQLFDLRRTD